MFALGVSFLNYDDICMHVVNKKFGLLVFVFDSVYVDLQYDKMSLTVMFVCLCGLPWSVCEVVLVLYVDVVMCTIVCAACVYAESVVVTAMLVWGMEEVWLW